jgi:hypothetical protein
MAVSMQTLCQINTLNICRDRISHPEPTPLFLPGKITGLVMTRSLSNRWMTLRIINNSIEGPLLSQGMMRTSTMGTINNNRMRRAVTTELSAAASVVGLS